MVRTITKIIHYFIVEILIIFSYIFILNNFIGNADKPINSDGIGYYDYLPSLFIHHDLIRNDYPIGSNQDLYTRINAKDVYITYNNFKVDKFPCGTALLQLPFYTYALLTYKPEGTFDDGYQQPFQRAIFHAAIFYLFLSIVFLKKILKLYTIKTHLIVVCQLLLVLGTSVTHYANADSSFSHIYSLFAISCFIYFTAAFFKQFSIKYFFAACLFLGLIILLRQINVIIILFIPFLAGSLTNLKNGIAFFRIHWMAFFSGILIITAMCSVQSLLWYLQTGHIILDSYHKERFNFSDPYFFSILFSYKKGLFVYTPLLLFSLIGLLWLFYKRNYYMFLSWIFFFVTLSYILSSWWSWYYGCSYGLRAFVDFYPIFFIPIALFFNTTTKYAHALCLILSLLCIPLNIIQTYQYKEYIIHWESMSKEKYWKVFLKTQERYKGLFWKKYYKPDEYQVEHEISLGDVCIPKHAHYYLDVDKSSHISGFDKTEIIEITFENDFQELDDTKFILNISNIADKQVCYWHKRYLLHFHEYNFNEWQPGRYDFDYKPNGAPLEKKILLEIESADQNQYFKNVMLKFLSKKG